MNSEKPKTPQEELEELLRQAGGQPNVMPGISTPRPARAPLSIKGSFPKLSAQWLLIGGLALVLLIATIFFASGLVTQKSAGIEIRSDQDDLRLTIGTRVYEDVASGQRIAVAPGEHTFRASKDGFLDFVGKAVVAKKQYTIVNVGILPIPELKELVGGVSQTRLNANGEEVSYFDANEGVFKTQVLDNGTVAELFRGSFNNIHKITWSRTGQAAIVQFNGMPQLANSVDNRLVQGHYLPIGERPSQAPTFSNGISTWFFDDANKNSAGWQPVLLSENVRQVAFAPDGGEIIYIYEAADGEYSLIQAQPDGLEWERVITNLPRLNDPQLVWGSDSRYLAIIDGSKVFVADLLTKSLEQVFTDWVVGTNIVISPTGTKIAYVAGGENAKLKVYDLITRETHEVPNTSVATGSRIVWLNNLDLLVSEDAQTFKRIEVSTGTQALLPYAGTQIGAPIEQMQYSDNAHVLMVVAGGTVYYMNV